MEFYSGKPDNLAASVTDYCTGVLSSNGSGSKGTIPCPNARKVTIQSYKAGIWPPKQVLQTIGQSAQPGWFTKTFITLWMFIATNLITRRSGLGQ